MRRRYEHINWDETCAEFERAPDTLHHFGKVRGWDKRIQQALFRALQYRGLDHLIPRPGHAGREYRYREVQPPRVSRKAPVPAFQAEVMRKALAAAGSLRSLAKLLGVSAPMVQKYRDLKTALPPEKLKDCLEISRQCAPERSDGAPTSRARPREDGETG